VDNSNFLLTKTFILAKPGVEFAFKVKLMIVLRFAATNPPLGNSDFDALNCDE
jgi:hypothetical protein